MFYSSSENKKHECQQGSAGYSVTENHKTKKRPKEKKKVPHREAENWQGEDYVQ